MRTLHLAALFALPILKASPQVVFELPDAIPAFGAQERDRWDAPNDTSVVVNGQSVVWDFNNLVLSAYMQRVIAEPSTTPYADDFPSATHAVGEVYSAGTDTTWQYYTLAGDSLFYPGGSWPPDLLICSEPVLLAVFPFSYGDQNETVATCAFAGGSPSTYLEGRGLVATGTINYPGGTITDVALLQRWWNGTALDEYEWFTTDDILSSIGKFAYGSLTLFAPLVTSVQELGPKSLLKSVPNPATVDVVIEIPGAVQKHFQYQLIDPSGRVIRSGPVVAEGTGARLDVSDLPSGNYLARLTSSEDAWHARVAVAH